MASGDAGRLGRDLRHSLRANESIVAVGRAKRLAGSSVARYQLDGRLGVQFESRRGVAWAPGAPLGEVDATTAVAISELGRRLRQPMLLSPTGPMPDLENPITTDLFHTGTVMFDLSAEESEIRRHCTGTGGIICPRLKGPAPRS
jgi:hypothetical protein